MKKITLIHLAIFGVTVLATFSCKKKEEPKTPEPTPVVDNTPVACYNSSARWIMPKGVVTFNNCSSNHDRVEWNFGDGGSSTLSQPSHMYENAGVYDAVLTAFKGSNSAKVSKRVVVGKNCSSIMTIAFTDWKVPNTYQAFWVSPYRIPTSGSPFLVAAQGCDPDNQVSPKWGRPTSFPFTTQYPDPNQNYRIKIMFEGELNGPRVAVDSVFTDIIDPLAGPKTPTGSATLKNVNITYTLNGMMYN